MNIKYKYRLVLIEWEDSACGHQGWKSVEDSLKDLSLCTSVGFVVYEDKKVISLFAHLDGQIDTDLHGQGDMVIPKKCIVKRVELKIR